MNARSKTTTLRVALCWLGAFHLAAIAAAAPVLRFDRTTFDFGKTSLVETVSGTFKYTNTGDAVLKLEPPKPSCGCTVAALKPDTLKPGESGELAFTLNLGRSRATMEKHIAVTSNDPLAPEVSLTIKVDYTPLYDLVPMTLSPNLAFGIDTNEVTASITRTDGKPLGNLRLEASKAWITATLVPEPKGDGAAAKIRIAVRRDGSPRRFNEHIHVFSADLPNIPVSTVYLYGQIAGELSLSPESLYWSVTDVAHTPVGRPEAQVMRRIAVRSGTGKPFELKNPRSTIHGMKVELVRDEAGKSYEIVATLGETPPQTVGGTVTVDTSVAGQPSMEVPVIVNVLKP